MSGRTDFEARLVDQIERLRDELETVERERDKAIKARFKCGEELDEARQEIERLRDDGIEARRDRQTALDQKRWAQAERDRYEEALRRIADAVPTRDKDGNRELPPYRSWAKIALSPPGGEE